MPSKHYFPHKRLYRTEDLHHPRQGRRRDRHSHHPRRRRRPRFHGSDDHGLQAKRPQHRQRTPPRRSHHRPVLADTEGGSYTNIQLDNIVVIAQARPDYKPPVAYHVPTAGDTVPDFHLINQSDRTIHLDQFKGKLLLLTFIYTRCQLADFCPRMGHNFADIDKALAADPALYRQTHLLSISFDPAYDTPKVLRSYGGAYTGNYTNEKFLHWDFAAPSEKDLPAVTQFFNVGVTPGDSKSLTHSLSTVLIGKDGRIVAWYPTNDWDPRDVVATIRKNAA